eukprot:1158293-Pelagomonas_calceolata.AAC.14
MSSSRSMLSILGKGVDVHRQDAAGLDEHGQDVPGQDTVQHSWSLVKVWMCMGSSCSTPSRRSTIFTKEGRFSGSLSQHSSTSVRSFCVCIRTVLRLSAAAVVLFIVAREWVMQEERAI